MNIISVPNKKVKNTTTTYLSPKQYGRRTQGTYNNSRSLCEVHC